GDVNDDAQGTKANHLLQQAAAEIFQIRVGKSRLNGGDEDLTLLEDSDFHVIPLRSLRLLYGHDLVPQEPFGLFDAALQVADGVHLTEVHAYGDEGLRNFRRQAGDNDCGAQQAGSFHGLYEVVGHGSVHGRHTGDVDNHDLGAIGADPAEELLRELAGALRVDHADDGENQQALAHLKHGSGGAPD